VYNGFYPARNDVGLKRSDEYVRSRQSDPIMQEDSTAQYIPYWDLAAYEWLKAADRSGEPLQKMGAHEPLDMPNSENIWSPDYQLAARRPLQGRSARGCA